MTNGNGLMSPEDQKIAGEALQTSLVDLLGISLQGKQAHWNVTGKHFRPVHKQLDKVVSLARGHADTLAERAAAIGVSPDGRAETIARETSAPFGAGPVPDTEVVQKITKLLAETIAHLNEGIRDTDQADPVTQDMLISVAQDMQQQHWMFSVQMK